jgi:outer membrane protein
MRIGNNTRWKLLSIAAIILVANFNPVAIQAQDTWSLQRCIEFARTNSLTLKQAEYNIAFAKLTDKQNQLSRLPNASANTSAGWQFGRTIDPTTNSFNNRTIAFNSMGLNVGATLFAGGRINNTIKQGKIDVQAAEKDAMASFNNIALNIANAYLSILMAEEQLDNANRRLKLSQDQLSQTNKLIDAGSLPANDRLDVLAQIANDEQAIVQSKNSIELNYLTLKELMQIDPATDLKIERPEFNIPADANPTAVSFGEVYGKAVNTQPQIIASELRVHSAEVDIKLAQSGYYPSISLFGGLDSRWSDASKLYDIETGTVRVNNIYYVNTTPLGLPLGVVPVDIGTDVPYVDAIPKNYPYFDQIKDNFGQNIGAALRIPIYSNGVNDINVQRAQVGILNAQVNSDLQKQQLKNDVQQSIASARAAQLTLEASQKAIDAAKVAFENAELRFKLGTINNLQLLTARNTYDTAQTNLTVAKYDYLFRLKILDFYLGKEIKLD